MRKFLLAIGFVTFAVAVFAAVAYQALLLPHERPKANTTSLPLEFSIQLEKTEFLRSEDVAIQISLKNIGNKTISLSWPDFYLYNGTAFCFDFNIIDTRAPVSLVYRYSQNKVTLEAVKEKTLTSGEQWVDVVVWDQRASYKDDPEPVPRGGYSLRAFTRQFALSVDGQTSILDLKTPTITFTIK
jgi:hypothetical protein